MTEPLITIPLSEYEGLKSLLEKPELKDGESLVFVSHEPGHSYFSYSYKVVQTDWVVREANKIIKSRGELIEKLQLENSVQRDIIRSLQKPGFWKRLLNKLQ